MPLVTDPSWTGYKRALARVADAGQRLDLAQGVGSCDLETLEREFQDALRAYDAAREQMDRARAPDDRLQTQGALQQQMDGQVVRIAGLASSRQDHDFREEGSTAQNDRV